MKLRIWLPCILLIVIFIILVRKYFTDTEGFQASTPYVSPPPQNPEKTKDNFWLILSKYGTSGSTGTSVTGTSGSGSGSGSGPPSISNLVDQVMNPKPKDTFQMVFPKYVSMYALAKYNYDPVTARTVLINEYDVLQTDLQTAVETEQRSRNEFASDPKGESCKQINRMTMAFYGELIKLYKGAQDLTGVVKNAGSFHDENLSLQNIVLSACTTQSSFPSEDCRKLATMDEKLLPLLPRFDAINVNILADGEVIQDMIDTLVQAYMGMGCTRSTGGSGSAPPDGTPSIDTIFSDTYIDSLGTIDTDFLNEKLQELSPYYVSRNIINYISGKLIGTSEFNAGLSDSLDYLKDMNKVTNNIVSLNTDIAPLGTGKFFSESGATAGGFANCPPGYYCTVGSTMPIKCPVGTYCPAGTAGEAIQCPTERPFSPPGSTKEEDCKTTLPAGYYTDTTTGNLIECPTGHYCADGNRTLCPPGTYNMKKGMGSITACLDCPKGSYCKTTTSITPCDPGTYNDKPRQFTSGSSGSGSSSGSSGSSGSSNGCLPCPQGTSCTNKGTVTPMPCPAGTYSATLGLKVPCTPVTQGYYLEGIGNKGESTKKECSAGYYCPGGTGAPLTCPTGSYCSRSGLSNATLCPAGSYGSTVGLISEACSGTCDAGYLCPAGSSSSTAIACPPGYYCPAGSGTATICPTGAYCPRLSRSPILCPAGTYNEVAGKTQIGDCLPCPPGKECGVGTSNPTPCRIGFYCPGGVESIACIPGYYCDEIGLVEAKICPPGTYKPGGGYRVTDCLPCREGTWSNTPGEINGCRETCPSGSYCPSPNAESLFYKIPSTAFAVYPKGSGRTIIMPIGATYPEPCPVGTYCDKAGTAIPTPCPAGTYSTRTGQQDASTCKPCEVGTYCPTAGAGSQLLCPVGTFCPTQGGSSPTQCLIGQICPVPGLQAGSACPPGKLCDITGIGPPPPFKSCPPGTYSTGGAGSSCTNCPPGTIGSGDSTTSACSGECPAGYTCSGGTTPLGGSNPPLPCTTGHYCPVGTGAPIPCPAGYYCSSGRTHLGGDSPPLPCPVGYYCPVGRGVCPQGTTPLNGKCCPSGMTLTSNGCVETETTAIVMTHYQGWNLPSYTYWGCPDGNREYIDYGWTVRKCRLKPIPNPPVEIPPIDCPDGTYGGVTGLATNTCSGQCPAGYYCTPGTTGISGSSTNPPKLCPSGKFCPAGTGGLNSSSPPQNCPAGKSGTPSATSLEGCTTCPAGTFSTSGSACTQCPIGTFSAAGAGSCTPCAAGTFSNTLGATTCTGRCPAGTFSTTLGATSSATCLQCNPGTYSADGAGSCTQCAPGTFSATAGAGSCTPCAAGTFSNTLGATTCTGRCPAGTFSTTVGATSSTTCLQCAAGSHSPSTGAASCTPCPAGKYSSTLGAVLCDECAAGKYSTAVGATSVATCTPCPGGTYSHVYGRSSACEPCPAGRFSPPGSTSCQWCPQCTYSPGGQELCTGCPAGRYSRAGNEVVGAATSISECEICPAGYYGTTVGGCCAICPKGTYSGVAGASSCTPCPAGTFGMYTGRTSVADCEKCTAAGPPIYSWHGRGRFSTTVGATNISTCQDCPVGTRVSDDRTRCNPG